MRTPLNQGNLIGQHILINRLNHSRNVFHIIRTGKHKTTGGVHAIKQIEHISRCRTQTEHHGMAGSLFVGEEIVKERFWRTHGPISIQWQTHANWRIGIGIVPKLHQIVIVTDERAHMTSIVHPHMQHIVHSDIVTISTGYACT